MKYLRILKTINDYKLQLNSLVTPNVSYINGGGGVYYLSSHPNNEIWYSTIDNTMIDIHPGDICDAVNEQDELLEVKNHIYDYDTNIGKLIYSDIVYGLIPTGGFDGKKLSYIKFPNTLVSCPQYPIFDGNNFLPENGICYADTYLVEVVDKTLTTYDIKEGTKFIGSSAFDGCASLTNITIPNSVTHICWAAFRDCTSLTSITIPESVTAFGEVAFGFCTSLKEVYFKHTTPPYFPDDAFYPTPDVIYVPFESLALYKASWPMYADKIIGYNF